MSGVSAEIFERFRKAKKMGISFEGKSLASLGAAQGKGDQVPMGQAESCSRMNCSNRAVTSVGEENFCFDHFCSRCYELLEGGDSPLSPASGDYAALAALLYRLDECAQRALEISLSEIELNNLDRARLLDILLWSGDVTTTLRQKRGKPNAKRASAEAGQVLVEGRMGHGRLN
jgi:hypothetical protein